MILRKPTKINLKMEDDMVEYDEMKTLYETKHHSNFKKQFT